MDSSLQNVLSLLLVSCFPENLVVVDFSYIDMGISNNSLHFKNFLFSLTVKVHFIVKLKTFIWKPYATLKACYCWLITESCTLVTR